MTHDELIETLLNTNREDWLRHDSRGMFTCKVDLNITVRAVDEDGRKTFTEEWANRFPHPPAYTRVFELWYGASLVNEYYFAAVDDFRAYLPYPCRDNLTITPEQYAIACAVNLHDNLEDYLQRAGIRVA